jgi:N-acetylneuraminate synthase
MWKVGSGEVSNIPQLDAMAATGKPILLSSGMSSWVELEETVRHLKAQNVPLALFQATTSYPSPPEKLGLNLITEYKSRFSLPVGLSDHSGTIYPALAAYTLGARFVEVHVTLSRRMFGPDVIASITIEELQNLVEGLRFLETAFTHPVNKDEMAGSLSEMRQIFSKSVVAATDLPAQKVLEPADLTLRKPGTGIPASHLYALYGRRIKAPIAAGTFFSMDDVE